MLFSVEWESQAAGADCDYSLPIVKDVIFVELNLFLPALIKLLLKALLIGDHIDNALVYIPAVA